VSLSTHVLDATTGLPAAGLRIELHNITQHLYSTVTDPDGRVRDLGAPAAGVYQLVFDTGSYFSGRGIATFYPEVIVTFEVTDAETHHHVPLLLSPFAYSTYRGS
jgi:5-hydroxyisourate hydrolase